MSTCQATIYMAHIRYQCDADAPHPGIAHSALTLVGDVWWCSDGEARRHRNNHQPKAAHQ